MVPVALVVWAGLASIVNIGSETVIVTGFEGTVKTVPVGVPLIGAALEPGSGVARGTCWFNRRSNSVR